ncbi:MAG: hypothetical protein ACKO2P_15620 [Planctomycetota bacterium]
MPNSPERFRECLSVDCDAVQVPETDDWPSRSVGNFETANAVPSVSEDTSVDAYSALTKSAIPRKIRSLKGFSVKLQL